MACKGAVVIVIRVQRWGGCVCLVTVSPKLASSITNGGGKIKATSELREEWICGFDVTTPRNKLPSSIVVRKGIIWARTFLGQPVGASFTTGSMSIPMAKPNDPQPKECNRDRSATQNCWVDLAVCVHEKVDRQRCGSVSVSEAWKSRSASLRCVKGYFLGRTCAV
jgi:hypothetical protein